MQQRNGLAPAEGDLVAIVAEDFRARVAEAVDRLVTIAHAEENILRTELLNQFILLAVDVLKFIEHHLAELLLNFLAHIGIVFQKRDGMTFEIVEIDAAERGFALAV